MDQERVKVKQIYELKDYGNQAYGRGDFDLAIKYYRSGIEMAEKYG